MQSLHVRLLLLAKKRRISASIAAVFGEEENSAPRERTRQNGFFKFFGRRAWHRRLQPAYPAGVIGTTADEL